MESQGQQPVINVHSKQNVLKTPCPISFTQISGETMSVKNPADL